MEGAQLRCVKCGDSLPLSSFNMRCEVCQEPFEVTYRCDARSTDLLRRPTRSEALFEHYAGFYPFLKIDEKLSLGEGRTPLVRSRSVARELGVDRVFFKNETQNPTWTFKDRGTACSIQHAAALGCQRIGTLSSGNMGASVAAFGRHAGMETFVLLKKGVPQEKIDAIAVYQVRVIVVSGAYNNIYDEALAIGRTHGIYFSVSDEPMRVEGYKTVAFEIVEQLQLTAPNVVAVPVGSGGLCRGIIKGFEELQSTGLIDRLPTFVGVQSTGCSPVVDAFEEGLDAISCFPEPRTIDHVLENPLPASGNQLLRKMRACKGILTKVNPDQIVAAALGLARDGIFAQPASATALAGITQCVERGMIPRDATIVSIVTGSGLKYPPAVAGYGLSTANSSLEHLADAITVSPHPADLADAEGARRV